MFFSGPPIPPPEPPPPVGCIINDDIAKNCTKENAQEFLEKYPGWTKQILRVLKIKEMSDFE